MRHKFFEIKNFKGIEQVKIDFDSKPQSDVYTLVGLNESGKTTILEALNFFSYKAETLNPLNLPGYTVKDVHELIPISKRSNFNDDISIKVGQVLITVFQIFFRQRHFRCFLTPEDCYHPPALAVVEQLKTVDAAH